MSYSDEHEENSGTTVETITVYAGRSLYNEKAEPIEFVVSSDAADAIFSGDREWMWALIACIIDEAATS